MNLNSQLDHSSILRESRRSSYPALHVRQALVHVYPYINFNIFLGHNIELFVENYRVIAAQTVPSKLNFLHSRRLIQTQLLIFTKCYQGPQANLRTWCAHNPPSITKPSKLAGGIHTCGVSIPLVEGLFHRCSSV